MNSKFKPIFPPEYDSKWYDKFWDTPPYGYELKRRQFGYDMVKSLIPFNSSVFDYACGFATISLQLEKEKSCKIEGCDFSETIIKRVGKRGFYVGSEIKGHHDFVIVSHFLEHISNPADAVEYYKEHGETIIIVIPNNFRNVKEHRFMQWKSLKEFERLIRGAERVEINYPKSLSAAFKCPIYVVKVQ